jgi:hypothetical protein
MNREQLLAIVQQRIAAMGHGIALDFIEDGVRRDGDWWYVPVLAARNGHDVPREVTINVYANVEDEREQQHGTSVLFVPAVNEPAA